MSQIGKTLAIWLVVVIAGSFLLVTLVTLIR